MAPRTGLVVPMWLDRPPLEAIELARRADAIGLDEVWIGELVTFDAFALAGAIARETRRITPVIGPLPVHLRDPASLALGLASIAALGDRPARLALGASTPTLVDQWHGTPWRRPADRLRETVAALRPILAGGRSSFRGNHIRTEGFRLAAPPPPVEISIAAFGPAMIRAAAEVADRVVVNLITPAQVGRVRAALDAAAAAAGRPSPPIVVWVVAAIDPDAAAIAQLTGQLIFYLAPRGYGEMFTEAGFGEVVALARSGAHPRQVLAAVPRALIEAVTALGDEATVKRKIAAYQAAGADAVAVVPLTAHDPGAARLLGALFG
jgi:probable F420-dependent oxidoreductase